METAHTIEYRTPQVHSEPHEGAVHPHIVPPRVLLSVYFVLVAATIITVLVTLVDLGELNIWVALAIAVFKAAMVILYFMHVRWDSPFNAVILISAIAFVMVFIATTIMDSGQYKMNYQPPGTRQMMSSQNGI